MERSTCPGFLLWKLHVVRLRGVHEHLPGPVTVITGEHTWPGKGKGLVQGQVVSWVLVFLYLKFSSFSQEKWVDETSPSRKTNEHRF